MGKERWPDANDAASPLTKTDLLRKIEAGDITMPNKIEFQQQNRRGPGLPQGKISTQR
jgi:hypothetical protein